METRKCKQCGELKPLGQFRKYYGGRKGHYTSCLTCEKINNREKYLSRKATLSDTEAEELDKIHMLWGHQVSLGLRPPTANGRKATLGAMLDAQLERYAAERDKVTSAAYKASSVSDTPAELTKWLTEELTDDPDYYTDEVYERLCAAYRPVLHIDSDTHMPVHDETYKVLLDRILDRFTAYEDAYYNKDKE